MFFNLLGLLAVLGSCGMAFRWGGLDERVAAISLILATIGSKIAAPHYVSMEATLLFIDGAVLVALVVLALRSDRFWPMWAAAFQLVGTMVHIASMTETGDFAWAYAVGLIFWSYPVLIALMAGTWLEARYRLR
jgi:hypothetical protein